MKIHISTFILFLSFFSCKQPSETQKYKEEKSTPQFVNRDVKTIHKTKSDDTLKTVQESNNQKHYITEDSIVIDGMVFYKETINKIIDKHPELFNEEVRDPNYTYYELSQQHYSELGIDEYYSIYAHFLRQRYDYTLYQREQENLDTLYNGLIELFSRLKGGGTYFGHEMSRIPGFIEYSTYTLDKNKERFNNQNFQQDKKDFISFLQNKVDQAAKEGFGIQDLIDAGNYDKKELIDNYYALVDKIAHLITEPFYLEQAKNYSNF